jgi:hypothetical protein
MPEDASYYDDSPPGGAAADAQGDDGAKTAILPKSLFGRELKPGDKCDVEICAVHENDYEVKGCLGHGEKEGEPEEAPKPAASPMSSMLED